MMRTSLIALVTARFFQAPSPASVPVSAPMASNAMPYMEPMSYGFEQAAFPSAPVVVPVAPPTTSSSSKALPLMAGAALGATVAVLFGGGRSSAKPKAAAKKPAAKAAAKKPVAKAAAKKPVAKAAPKPAPKPAPKRAVAKAPAKKSSDPFFNKTAGKGGLFPWVTNEPGTYSKPLMLSAIDFTGDQGDSFVGWGAMPNSVKALYNPKGRKGLFGGCTTPAKK